MLKRSVSWICALVLMVGLLPAATVVAEGATEQKYEVGYAIRNINPYEGDVYVEGETEIYDFVLTGNGDDADRPCDGIMDDNGDGVVDEKDGLFVTCVSVTDAAENTVMILSLDLLKGYNTIIDSVRKAIVERVAAEGGAITADQIVISGSHTHSGPCTDNLSEVYLTKIRNQMTEAAVAAYLDRAPATMKRGSVDTMAATKEKYGTSYKMNFLRHYKVTATATSSPYLFGGAKTDTKYYIAGPNFGKTPTIGAAVSAFGTYDYGTMYTAGKYLVEKIEHTEDADHTMGLLTFEFESAEKEPIVMVNWAAHPTTNSGVDPLKASSDYINALRYTLGLEANGSYRTAFIQAAGGNSIVSSDVEEDWREKYGGSSSVADENKAAYYGQMLADIALYAMNEGKSTYMTESLPAGEIKNLQVTFQGEIQNYDAAYNTAANDARDNATSYPYTASNGKIINSNFHWQQIVRRYADISAGATTYMQEINVIALGDSALFVTSPNELSDYYNASGARPNGTNNQWAELEGDYGAPFVITNANGNMGYLPNTLNYLYNTSQDTQGANGAELLSPGSYEANTSYFEKGTGEALLDKYAEMIDWIEGAAEKTAPCEACGLEEVQWQAVSPEMLGSFSWEDGHYYLTDDLSNFSGALSGDRVCLDLNGCDVSCRNRFFSISEQQTLNIFDTQNSAVVTGYATGSNVGGGVFMVNGTLSIYGGTFRFVNKVVSDKGGTGAGGIAYVNGTMNVYGGRIEGADMIPYTGYTNNNYTGRGGAVLVSHAASLRIYGGEITSGSVPEGGAGPCVYMQNDVSRLILSGDAFVEDIYNNTTAPSNNFTISGAYTGTVNFTFPDNTILARGKDIGNALSGADISGATFTFTDKTKDWKVIVSGSDLLLDGYGFDTVALIGNTEYSSLQAAVEAYNGTFITMICNEDKAVNVTKDAYLDLNGFDITGEITANSGFTLYCKDSKTDDYTVADEQGNLTDYGKITNIAEDAKENIKGIPEEATVADITVGDDKIDDGYLMVAENDGVSFHRVNLDLTAMALRASAVGVYFESAFAADEVVASKILRFGVALSVRGEPTASNMETDCKYSWFEKEYFKHGEKENLATSTIVHSVMKTTNLDMINRRYAEIPIYGRAYILTEEGYMFGETKSRSFREQVEAANGIWNDLTDTQKSDIIAMYKTFENAMSDWNVAAIADAATK